MFDTGLVPGLFTFSFNGASDDSVGSTPNGLTIDPALSVVVVTRVARYDRRRRIDDRDVRRERLTRERTRRRPGMCTF